MRGVASLCFLGVVALGLLTASSASAQVFSMTAGAKGFVGGNVWTTPSSIPGSYEGHGFAGSGGGFGWGAGLYAEARFIKFLGLELDLIYDKSTLFRDVTTSLSGAPGVNVKSREKVDMGSLRIPVLAKGILPVPFGRLSVMLGPEFIVPTSTSGGVEQTGGSPGARLADPGSLMKAEKKGSTMLTMGLGLTIELPLKLELPIEMRASKNMTQPDAWADRVSWAAPNYQTPYTVKGQSSWDFRLGLGIGRRF